MENNIISRSQLYNFVWAEPITSLSKKWDFPASGIRELCQKMNVPLPPNGHWQKIKFGKDCRKLPLPSDSDCQQQFDLSKKLLPKKSGIKIVEKVLNDQVKKIVTQNIVHPHKLVLAAKECLESKNIHTDNGIMKYWRGIIDIKVTRHTLSRALRIMDLIIKMLHERGHNVILKDDQTFAIIKEQEIKISIREKTKMERKVDPKYNFESNVFNPTGKLIFKMEAILISTKEWLEHNTSLEEQIPSIITRLEAGGEELVEHRKKIDKQHEIWRNEAKQKKDFMEAQERDLTDFKEMLEKSDRWHKAVNLRRYILEVELKSPVSQKETTEKWLIWAKRKADWFDPFIESPDELLEDINRETLTIKKKTVSGFS